MYKEYKQDKEIREETIKPRQRDLQWFGYEALFRPTPLLEYPTRDFTMSISSLQAEKTVTRRLRSFTTLS